MIIWRKIILIIAWVCSVSLLIFAAGCRTTNSDNSLTLDEQWQDAFERGRFFEIHQMSDLSEADSWSRVIIKLKIALHEGKVDQAELFLGQASQMLSEAELVNLKTTQRFHFHALKAQFLAQNGRFDESIELALSTLAETTPETNNHREFVEGLVALSNSFRICGEIHHSRDTARKAVIMRKTKLRFQPVTGFAIRSLARVHADLDDFDAAFQLYLHAFKVFRFNGGSKSVFAAETLVDAAETLIFNGHRHALDDQGDFQDNSTWIKEASSLIETADAALESAGILPMSPTALRLENLRALFLLKPRTLCCLYGSLNG